MKKKEGCPFITGVKSSISLGQEITKGVGKRGGFSDDGSSPSSCDSDLWASKGKESVFWRLGIPSKSKVGNMMKPLLQLLPSAIGLLEKSYF